MRIPTWDGRVYFRIHVLLDTPLACALWIPSFGMQFMTLAPYDIFGRLFLLTALSYVCIMS